ALFDDVLKDLAPVAEQLDHLQFHIAIAAILAAGTRVNRFIEDKAPWKMAKTSLNETAAVLHDVLLSLYALLFYLLPFMPETARTIWQQLGQTDDLNARAKA